jgi:hypothetical protein
VRKISAPYKFEDGKLFDAPRIAFLGDAIENDTLRHQVGLKWDSVLALPDEWVVEGAVDPWDIPAHYGPGGAAAGIITSAVHADSKACAGYAYRYSVLGDEDDALRAAAILAEYAAVGSFVDGNDSSLKWHDSWSPLVQAAMMIQNSPAHTPTLEANFKSTLTLALNTLEPIAYTRTNNWAAWGLAMEFAAASYLEDRARFDRAIRQWRVVFDSTVVSDFLVENGGPADGEYRNNVAHREVYRMGGSQGNGSYGLLYSAFHLDGMTIAAEYARLNGEWLFDHVSPDGSSLQGFWEEIAYMKRNAAPSLSADYLNVQWYNTSNTEDPGHEYYYEGYYTNRVGPSFYILQELWPLDTAREIMHGGFMTRDVAPGTFPPDMDGSTSQMHNGVPILQDYYGMFGADLAYSDRPLYG